MQDDEREQSKNMERSLITEAPFNFSGSECFEMICNYCLFKVRSSWALKGFTSKTVVAGQDDLLYQSLLQQV